MGACRSGEATAAVAAGVFVHPDAMSAEGTIHQGMAAVRPRDEQHRYPTSQGKGDGRDQQVFRRGITGTPGCGGSVRGGSGVRHGMAERRESGVEGPSHQKEQHTDDYEQPQRALHQAVHSLPHATLMPIFATLWQYPSLIGIYINDGDGFRVGLVAGGDYAVGLIAFGGVAEGALAWTVGR